MAVYYVSSLATGGGDGSNDTTQAFTPQEGLDNTTASDKCWWKNDGVYTLTAQLDADTNAGDATLGRVRHEGYTTTIGDGGRARITKTGAVAQLLVRSVNYLSFKNFEFYGADGDGINGLCAFSRWENVTVRNCGAYGIDTNGNSSIYINVDLYENLYGINFNNVVCLFLGGSIHNNTRDGGINFYASSEINGTKVYGNGWNGINGRANVASSGWKILNCLIDGNGRSGIVQALGAVSTGLILIRNNTITNHSNAGYYGIDFGFASVLPEIDGNAYYGNDTDVNNVSKGDNDVDLTVDPYTNQAGGDYTLNNTAGGGADCRSVGLPSLVDGDTNYLDIGALQVEPLDVSTQPTATTPTTTSASISETAQTTLSTTVTNTPDDVSFYVNGKWLDATNTAGSTWEATVYGYQIGTGASLDVTAVPTKSGLASNSATASSLQTVTASASKTELLLTEMAASLASLSPTITVYDEKTKSDVDNAIRTDVKIITASSLDEVRNLIVSEGAGWTGVSALSDINEWGNYETSGGNTTIVYRIFHT